MNNLPALAAKHFTEFMEAGKVVNRFGYCHCGALLLNDNTELSIQAGRGLYSSPRETMTHYGEYTHFEIGFLSRTIPEIMEYAEDSENPTTTVYGYVPKEVIEEFINKAGGVKCVLYKGELC